MLLSALVVILMLVVLNVITLFCLLFTLTCVLRPLINKLVIDFNVVTTVGVVLVTAIVVFHGGLVVSPVMGFLTNLFLGSSGRWIVGGRRTAPRGVALRCVTQLGARGLRRVHKRGGTVAQATRQVFTPLTPTASRASTVVESFGAKVTVFSNIMVKIGVVGGVHHFFEGKWAGACCRDDVSCAMFHFTRSPPL